MTWQSLKETASC